MKEFADRLREGCKTQECIRTKAIIQIAWDLHSINSKLLDIYMKM